MNQTFNIKEAIYYLENLRREHSQYTLTILDRDGVPLITLHNLPSKSMFIWEESGAYDMHSFSIDIDQNIIPTGLVDLTIDLDDGTNYKSVLYTHKVEFIQDFTNLSYLFEFN